MYELEGKIEPVVQITAEIIGTGPRGRDGKDGYTPIKGVDYFDGVDGRDGVDGKDGYTPIKGVDYWTPDEVEEIVEQPKRAEEERVLAETNREQAERVLAETNREQAELLREKAETGREQAETERQAQEQKREEFFGTVEGEIAELKSDLSDKLTKPETAQVGQIFRIKSINDDGSLVLEAVDMPSGGGGGAVDDVQINGTSIVADGVANIPASKNGKYGVIRTLVAYGVDVGADGQLVLVKAENLVIDSRASNYRAIVPQNLDYAVKAAMCDGKGAEWTAEERAAARDRMGFPGAFELLVSRELTETVINISFDLGKTVNEIYMLCKSPKITAISPCSWSDENNKSIGYWPSSVLSTNVERYVMTHFYAIDNVMFACETRYGTNNLAVSTTNISYYNELNDGISKLIGKYAKGFAVGTKFTIWGR